MNLLDLEKHGNDLDKIATVGWLKQFVLETKIISIDSINYSLSYFTKILFESEGIVVTDEMELNNQQVIVLLYLVDKFYKDNTLSNINNTYITNNFYISNSEGSSKINSKVLLLAFLVSFTGNFGSVISEDMYNSVKSKYTNIHSIEENSFEKWLSDIQEIKVFTECNVNSVAKIITTSDYTIGLVSESENWFQIYFINEDASGVGYIQK